ncbi:MAG: alpha/beta hydrolase [Neisseria sp.]|nr:alpha/beta hydrolase [Neisseria sp.]
MSKTILMIHGMWGGAWHWDNYRTFFEQAGYRTVAVDLPYHGKNLYTADERLGTTGVLDYVDFLSAEIAKLDEKPIIMGHSMGGLLAQMLAARGLAEKAVLLTPAPPAGIIAARPSVIKTFLPLTFLPNFWNKPIPVTYPLAKYAVFNLVDDEQECRRLVSQMSYESGRAIFEIGFWQLDKKRTTRINEQDVQCPMLILSGSYDRIVPASVVFHVWRKYRHCADYHCLSDHAHWVLGEKGWEKIAERVANWLEHTTAHQP